MGISNAISILLIIVFSMIFFFFIGMSGISSMTKNGEIGLLNDFINFFETSFLNMFTVIGDNVIKGFDELSSDVKKESAIIKSDIEKDFKLLKSDSDSMFKSISKKSDQTISLIKSKAKDDLTKFKSILASTINEITSIEKTAISIMEQDVEKLCTTILNDIKVEFNWFATYIPSEIEKIFKTFYNDTVGLADDLGATIEEFLNEAEDGLIYAGSELAKDGQKLYNSTVNDVDKVANTVAKVGNTVVNTVEKTAQKTTKTVTKALNPAKW